MDDPSPVAIEMTARTISLGDFGRTTPGVRVLFSRQFRLLAAGMLILLGTAMNLLLLSGFERPGDDFAHDFLAFYGAAVRMSQGESPYFPYQIDGPVDAVCDLCYLYPPVFAQALTPLTAFPQALAVPVWHALQALAAIIALWLATGVGGAQRSLERLAWCLVATLLFVPVFFSLRYGNVSTLLALSVTLAAMGGTASGAAAAAGALLKVAPATLVPLALAADRRSRRVVLGGLAAMVLISVVLAPGAWLEYARVLPNLLAGSSSYIVNLAPANLASLFGFEPGVVTFVRALAVVSAIGCVAVSVLLSRRKGGLPAAALLATVAMLLLPATIWYHYLVILLPFAAMAWPRAGSALRVALLLSAVLILIGVGQQALATLGASCLVVSAGVVLWPRARTMAPAAG